MVDQIHIINIRINVSEVNEETLCIGVARVGSETQQIRAGNLTDLAQVDLGGPLHSLVIVGDTHPLEQDYIKQFML